MSKIIQKFKQNRLRKLLTGGKSPDGIYVDFPDYQVDTNLPANAVTDFFGFRRTNNGKHFKAGLGHGMVISVNEDTGETRGSEYGRYDSANRGLARRVRVPRFKMNNPGNPTQEELDAYAKALNDSYGHSGGTTHIVYVKGADEEKMNELMRSAETNNRENGYYVNHDYRILDHNCGTYGCDLLIKSLPWYQQIWKSPGYTWGRPSSLRISGKNATYKAKKE